MDLACNNNTKEHQSLDLKDSIHGNGNGNGNGIGIGVGVGVDNGWQLRHIISINIYSPLSSRSEYKLFYQANSFTPCSHLEPW
jgi:hypothetical protein